MPKLLIIDDDESVRQALGFAASLDGWEIHSCDQFTDALKMIQDNGIDVLLLDYWMPPINGLDLLAHLRQNDITIPVLMVSAYVPDINPTRAHSLGIHHILQKPPDIFDLRRMLKEVVGRD